MVEFALWMLNNLERIGIVTGSVAITVGFIWALAAEHLVLGTYHRREVAAGKEALDLLPAVNEKLADMKTTAAEQRIRDEYGRRDMDELRRKWELCVSDLASCREARDHNRGRA